MSEAEWQLTTDQLMAIAMEQTADIVMSEPHFRRLLAESMVMRLELDGLKDEIAVIRNFCLKVKNTLEGD
jgi:hypothetical protein